MKRKSKASPAVRAAADAAERRSKGVPLDKPKTKPKRKGAKPGSRTRAAVAPSVEPPAEPDLMARARAAIGRPTKYDPEMCVIVVAAGMEGCGKAEIASRLGVVHETVNEWCKKHPDFSAAITRAMAESAAWWERLGRQGPMLGKAFNATAYEFQTCNRFRGEWSKKVTVAGDPDSPPIIERVEYVIVDPAQEGRA